MIVKKIMKTKKYFDVLDYLFETNKHVFITDYHLCNPADQKHEFLSDQNDFALFDEDNFTGFKGGKKLGVYSEKIPVSDS